MVDKRCFVQFPHPGKEHGLNSGQIWHKQKHNHMRKFMQFHGKWIGKNDTEHSGDLWAWGEWEPESDIMPNFSPA